MIFSIEPFKSFTKFGLKLAQSNRRGLCGNTRYQVRAHDLKAFYRKFSPDRLDKVSDMLKIRLRDEIIAECLEKYGESPVGFYAASRKLKKGNPLVAKFESTLKTVLTGGVPGGRRSRAPRTRLLAVTWNKHA